MELMPLIPRHSRLIPRHSRLGAVHIIDPIIASGRAILPDLRIHLR